MHWPIEGGIFFHSGRIHGFLVFTLNILHDWHVGKRREGASWPLSLTWHILSFFRALHFNRWLKATGIARIHLFLWCFSGILFFLNSHTAVTNNHATMIYITNITPHENPFQNIMNNVYLAHWISPFISKIIFLCVPKSNHAWTYWVHNSHFSSYQQQQLINFLLLYLRPFFITSSKGFLLSMSVLFYLKLFSFIWENWEFSSSFLFLLLKVQFQTPASIWKQPLELLLSTVGDQLIIIVWYEWATVATFKERKLGSCVWEGK